MKAARYNKEVRLRKRTTITAQSCKGHRKENSTIKPEIPADENQQRIKRKCDEHFKKSSNEPDQEAERLNDKLFIESLILAQDERWRYA